MRAETACPEQCELQEGAEPESAGPEHQSKCELHPGHGSARSGNRQN